MGHYYSEMACTTCGKIPCECPKQADMTHAMWMVDPATLEVMQVFQFDRKYKYERAKNGMVIPGFPEAKRLGTKLFVTGREALEHRADVLGKQIDEAGENFKKAKDHLEELRDRREMLLRGKLDGA